MAEWRLFPEGTVPHASTFEFHEHRERAPHLEQACHRDRLLKAAEYVISVSREQEISISDLGCGDGGLLSLLEKEGLDAWGYDFQPSNAVGWDQRGVRAELLNAFGTQRPNVQLGSVSVATEVLEHMADPHEAVRWIGETSQWIVASSPWNEHPGSHDECHVWAWDMQGYANLITQGGYRIIRHEKVNQFQVILGERA